MDISQYEYEMKFLLQQQYEMNIFLYSIIFVLALIIGYELLKRSKFFSFAISFLPFLALPFWITRDYDLFIIIKLYSVVLGMALFTLLRYTSLKNNKSLLNLLYFLLLLNILEPVILDIINSNFLNAIAGILLMITLPHTNLIKISKTKIKELLWDIPFLWFIGYTVWDLAFLLNNYKTSIVVHTLLLGFPIVVYFFNNKTWIQARAYSLGIYLITFFIYPKISLYKPIINISPFIIEISNILSIIFMISYLIYFLNKKLKFKNLHGHKL